MNPDARDKPDPERLRKLRKWDGIQWHATDQFGWAQPSMYDVIGKQGRTKLDGLERLHDYQVWCTCTRCRLYIIIYFRQIYISGMHVNKRLAAIMNPHHGSCIPIGTAIFTIILLYRFFQHCSSVFHFFNLVRTTMRHPPDQLELQMELQLTRCWRRVDSRLQCTHSDQP